VAQLVQYGTFPLKNISFLEGAHLIAGFTRFVSLFSTALFIYSVCVCVMCVCVYRVNPSASSRTSPSGSTPGAPPPVFVPIPPGWRRPRGPPPVSSPPPPSPPPPISAGWALAFPQRNTSTLGAGIGGAGGNWDRIIDRYRNRKI